MDRKEFLASVAGAALFPTARIASSPTRGPKRHHRTRSVQAAIKATSDVREQAFFGSDPSAFPPSTILAQTRFESTFSIDARSTTSWNQAQFWHGQDVSPFNYDSIKYFGDNQFWRVTSIVAGGGTTPPSTGLPADYVTSTIESVTGPFGSSTNVLKQAYTGANTTPNSVQQNFVEAQPTNGTNPHGGPNAVVDLYTRFWVRLDPNVQAAATSLGTAYWRTLWEYKAYSDYRIQIGIRNYHGGPPHWYIGADEGGSHFVGNPTVFWEFGQPGGTNVNVPLDQWFYIEVYQHRATDATGRFYFGVNGTTVVDRSGSLYGASNDEINILAIPQLYSIYISPSWQYIDQFEIRDFPPSALPCGPPI